MTLEQQHEFVWLGLAMKPQSRAIYCVEETLTSKVTQPYNMLYSSRVIYYVSDVIKWI